MDRTAPLCIGFGLLKHAWRSCLRLLFPFPEINQVFVHSLILHVRFVVWFFDVSAGIPINIIDVFFVTNVLLELLQGLQKRALKHRFSLWLDISFDIVGFTHLLTISSKGGLTGLGVAEEGSLLLEGDDLLVLNGGEVE